ncbi:MAG: hypothetical protein Q4615_10470 [Paracoccus aminovorans]|nr:hypothetical protein [Paracoccus aminovorans]
MPTIGVATYGIVRGPAGDGITPGERDKIDEAVAAADDLAVALPQVDQAREDAQAAAGQAAGDRAATEAARTAAEGYAAAAAQSAQFYDTIAMGRAAVADGQQFGVRAGGSDGLTRPTIYRRDSASAQTAMVTIVNPSEVDAEVSARRAIVRAASVDGYAAVVMDAASNATWLAARESDGAPPDWVIDHLVGRMEAPLGVAGVVSGLADEVEARSAVIREDEYPGYASLPMDENGNLFWTAVRDTDGGPPEWVVAHLAERLAPYQIGGSGGAVLPSERYVASDGSVQPIMPDMVNISLWGDSISHIYHPFLAAEMSELGATLYNGAQWGRERSTYLRVWALFRRELHSQTIPSRRVGRWWSRHLICQQAFS